LQSLRKSEEKGKLGVEQRQQQRGKIDECVHYRLREEVEISRKNKASAKRGIISGTEMTREDAIVLGANDQGRKHLGKGGGWKKYITNKKVVGRI